MKQTVSPRDTTAIDRTIGARIREARRASGRTQQDLADALGVTFQQVQKYEKGTNRVAASRLVEIAKYLDASPLWLLTGEGEPVA